MKVGDDAAGFAIAENLRGQMTGSKQAKFNAENAVSLVQMAEGGLNEQNNILIRLRELSVYAASDNIGNEERDYINTEFKVLVDEFDRIAKSTRFGSRELLTGKGDSYDFQVGAFAGAENVINFTLDTDTTASSVGIDGVDVSDKSSARDAIEEIDQAIQKVAGARAGLGAVQSRFQYAIDNLGNQEENLAAARASYMDVDVAAEAASLTQGKILQEIGTAVLGQANVDPSRVLRLIN